MSFLILAALMPHVTSGEHHSVEDTSLLKCRKVRINWYENKFADWPSFLSHLIGGGAAEVNV